MRPSLEELLAIAATYWPSSNAHALRQEASPETRRLQNRWEEDLAKIERWWAFLDELEKELPGFTIGDATATPDACFRCAAYPARDEQRSSACWVAVGCVSILAPVYTVYGVHLEHSGSTRSNAKASLGPLPLELQPPVEVITRRIEATFGVSALPRELAATAVPLFVQWKEPPHTTLFHALFTSMPESLP